MTEQQKDRADQHMTDCRSCGDSLTYGDEWWSHQWDENPSEENVEKALEDTEFRDWFVEKIVLCPTCHKKIVEMIRDD